MSPSRHTPRSALHTLLRAPRRALSALLCRLGVPADLYVEGQYVCRAGRRIFPKANEGLLTIAPDVECHETFFNLQDRITIECGVVLGHQVMFLTGSHELTPKGVDAGTASAGPIVVREGAWIASRAIVLGGVTIGRGAAVGAGAVVTRSVPDHELWAGNPARLIRRLEEPQPVLPSLVDS